MRQDWIELQINGDTYSVRPEYIVAFETAENGYTKLFVDSGNLNLELESSESYEQVKQKIMDAEQVDYSDVMVEHFTREEYGTLSYAITNLRDSYTTNNMMPDADKCQRIQNKLNEILKEGK